MLALEGLSGVGLAAAALATRAPTCAGGKGTSKGDCKPSILGVPLPFVSFTAVPLSGLWSALFCEWCCLLALELAAERQAQRSLSPGECRTLVALGLPCLPVHTAHMSCRWSKDCVSALGAPGVGRRGEFTRSGRLPGPAVASDAYFKSVERTFQISRISSLRGHCCGSDIDSFVKARRVRWPSVWSVLLLLCSAGNGPHPECTGWACLRLGCRGEHGPAPSAHPPSGAWRMDCSALSGV